MSSDQTPPRTANAKVLMYSAALKAADKPLQPQLVLLKNWLLTDGFHQAEEQALQHLESCFVMYVLYFNWLQLEVTGPVFLDEQLLSRAANQTWFMFPALAFLLFSQTAIFIVRHKITDTFIRL